MANITIEITSIRNTIAFLLPNSKFHLESLPKNPSVNSVAIDFAKSSNISETGASYMSNRTYQVVVFGSDGVDCLQKINLIDSRFSSNRLIPIIDSARYLRIESFSISKSFEIESGVFAIIGMLEVHTRELIPQQEQEKIKEVFLKGEN